MDVGSAVKGAIAGGVVYSASHKAKERKENAAQTPAVPVAPAPEAVPATQPGGMFPSGGSFPGAQPEMPTQSLPPLRNGIQPLDLSGRSDDLTLNTGVQRLPGTSGMEPAHPMNLPGGGQSGRPSRPGQIFPGGQGSGAQARPGGIQFPGSTQAPPSRGGRGQGGVLPGGMLGKALGNSVTKSLGR